MHRITSPRNSYSYSCQSFTSPLWKKWVVCQHSDIYFLISVHNFLQILTLLRIFCLNLPSGSFQNSLAVKKISSAWLEKFFISSYLSSSSPCFVQDILAAWTSSMALSWRQLRTSGKSGTHSQAHKSECMQTFMRNMAILYALDPTNSLSLIQRLSARFMALAEAPKRCEAPTTKGNVD